MLENVEACRTGERGNLRVELQGFLAWFLLPSAAVAVSEAMTQVLRYRSRTRNCQSL